MEELRPNVNLCSLCITERTSDYNDCLDELDAHDRAIV